MSTWWEQRSLRLSLALWYAGAAAVVLTLFAWFIYEVIHHRLRAEIDRQLRIDFDFIETQLETDAAGRIHWPLRGSHGDEGNIPIHHIDVAQSPEDKH